LCAADIGTLLLVALLTAMSFPALPAFGEGRATFASHQCSAYENENHFARTAALACLKHERTRECHQSAREFFKRCRFKGSYSELSKNFYAKMVAVMLFGRGRAVPDRKRASAGKRAPIVVVSAEHRAR